MSDKDEISRLMEFTISRIIPVEVIINYIQYEGKGYNIAFARDITERKAASDML